MSSILCTLFAIACAVTPPAPHKAVRTATPSTMAGKVTTLTLDSNRLVEIIGPMGGNVVGDAQAIDNLARQSKEPIYLLINSPGGSVAFGYTLIDAIHGVQARGIKVICATGVLAASMAFNTLMECNEVYALKYAKFMFHPVRSAGVAGQMEMELSAVELKEMDRRIIERVSQVTGMADDIIRKHYYRETLWEAYVLVKASSYNWMNLVDAIEGSNNVFVYERLIFNPFSGRGSAPTTTDPMTKPIH